MNWVDMERYERMVELALAATALCLGVVLEEG